MRVNLFEFGLGQRPPPLLTPPIHQFGDLADGEPNLLQQLYDCQAMQHGFFIDTSTTGSTCGLDETLSLVVPESRAVQAGPIPYLSDA